MITSLEIKGFRCFEHLCVPGLTRVNLIVGRNNSGKTSLLEAVELRHLGALALARGPIRRREEVLPDANLPAEAPAEVDVTNLFYGRELREGARFSIKSSVAFPYFDCKVEVDEEVLPEQNFYLHIERMPIMRHPDIRISALGGLEDKWRRAAFTTKQDKLPDLQFLGPVVPDAQWLGRLWEDVTLTPEEATVLDIVRSVVPDLERIAPHGFTRRGSANFLVKLTPASRRLPLGSLGDGASRLLALALHLAPCRGGVLLVDEIDTGLHFSVMAKMWQLVIGTARRLDTQVFATTHSEDCVRALAEAAEKDPEAAADISLHRIDPGETETMRYSADRLIGAIEHHIEVR